jgi:hypothetical protein
VPEAGIVFLRQTVFTLPTWPIRSTNASISLDTPAQTTPWDQPTDEEVPPANIGNDVPNRRGGLTMAAVATRLGLPAKKRFGLGRRPASH